ncbi:DASS family sodium-coupled anion symporter [Helicobacter sp. 11S02629-2]|uniref:DASS family sodium-coupled anion symporter n=1 Tax=Helicobacter sp. 11S02629-2 TaxID=1476195 RepID=UPI000BC6ECA7|nr:DASS family sodium-coupled anion symporter [Helicobacter sp. 11S02629-2]PAF45446.1 anion permease [Helicobacter sp. 11S02629-2]
MKQASAKSKIIKMIITILVGIVIFVLPTPEGLSVHAWGYLALFIALIVGLILEPIAPALLSLITIAIAILFKIGPVGTEYGHVNAQTAVQWGLSGFANTVVWLIFSAFMIGIGFTKSGLGRRISLYLVSKLGKKTLGLGYAIAIIDGILAPFIPSNAARSGSMYPMISSIPPMFDSTPENNPRKIGSYLAYTACAAGCVSSSIFLTASSSNSLALAFISKAGMVVPNWLSWFVAMLPVSIILFLLTPLLVYWFYPPTLKGSPEIVTWAKDELKSVGKMKKEEYFMLLISVVALVLWIGGSYFHIHSTTTALVVAIAMVILKVITWNDFLSNKPAWNVMVWLATLVTMAGGLKNVGFIEWISTKFDHLFIGFPPFVAIIGLLLLFSFLRYFFASNTAFATAFMTIFVILAQSIPGTDPVKTVLFLVLPMGFVGILAPYTTGPTTVWYASGYIKSSDFWRLGITFGMLYLIIFMVIGMPYINLIYPYLSFAR